MHFIPRLLTMATPTQPLPISHIERCTAFTQWLDMVRIYTTLALAVFANRIFQQDQSAPLSMVITVPFISLWPSYYNARPEGLNCVWHDRVYIRHLKTVFRKWYNSSLSFWLIIVINSFSCSIAAPLCRS